MSNLKIKINLARFNCFVTKLKGKSGVVKECIIIPIDDNKLFRGAEGFYADFIAFPIKERKPNQTETHYIKQSFTKEYLDSLTEEKKKELPFFGNVIDWAQNTNINQDPDFQNNETPTNIGDDLPF